MNRQALRPVEFRLDFRNEAFLSRLERIPVLSGHPQWAGDGRVRCIRSVETLKGTSVGGGGKTIYSEFSQIWWLTHWYLEPISRKIFHRNSNWMDISLCSHPNCREVIAMKFCTWHDNCVVPNFVAILCPAITGSRTETNFPSNLNYDGKIVREMGSWTKRTNRFGRRHFPTFR